MHTRNCLISLNSESDTMHDRDSKFSITRHTFILFVVNDVSLKIQMDQTFFDLYNNKIRYFNNIFHRTNIIYRLIFNQDNLQIHTFFLSYSFTNNAN